MIRLWVALVYNVNLQLTHLTYNPFPNTLQAAWHHGADMCPIPGSGVHGEPESYSRRISTLWKGLCLPLGNIDVGAEEATDWILFSRNQRFIRSWAARGLQLTPQPRAFGPWLAVLNRSWRLELVPAKNAS
jgi:hypothetical protein